MFQLLAASCYLLIFKMLFLVSKVSKYYNITFKKYYENIIMNDGLKVFEFARNEFSLFILSQVQICHLKLLGM